MKQKKKISFSVSKTLLNLINAKSEEERLSAQYNLHDSIITFLYHHTSDSSAIASAIQIRGD